MKKLFLPGILICFGLTSTACLNYFYSIDKEGHTHHITDDIRKKFNINFNKELVVSRLLKLETKLKKEHAYMLLSDYALGLMKLGKTPEALQILAEIYKHYPNDYKIASNLGTAYELTGQNDSALKYIKRGMELNPNDHQGSEWVHVKVLEAKLKLSKDPAYLNTSTVLGLTEKQEKDPSVLRQIFIQVHERFPFTPKPDAIMASLMTDLGDCYANTIAIEYALSSYTIAKDYFGDKSAALDEKIKATKALIKKYKDVKPDKNELMRKGEYPVAGIVEKIGTFSYKLLLDNNDEQNYKVDWTKININVAALLSLADLTISEKAVKDSALKNTSMDMIFMKDSVDSKNLVPDTKIADAKKQAKEKSNWILFSSGGAVVVILAAVAAGRKRKNNS